MALKNARANLGTSLSDIYTVPTGKTARVVHCQAANVHTGQAEVTLVWTDDSASDAAVTLCFEVPLPVNTSLAPIAGELVLEAGDKLRGRADGNSRIVVSVSVDEN